MAAATRNRAADAKQCSLPQAEVSWFEAYEDRMPVEDPLRSLAEVHSPDPRRQFIVGTLADEHAALSTICLHDGVPEPVAQLFETAKNVSLYSWFVYRFHPVSESVGFGALELALNLRKTGLLLLPDDFRSPGLSKLLREAVENGWIRDQEFPSRPAYAQHAAHLAAIAKIIEAGTPSVSFQGTWIRDSKPYP